MKVTVEANDPPEQVRPGTFVRVDIIKEKRPGATLVPREAIVRELQETHVFVVSDNKAVKREVSLGIEEDKLVQILGGVEAGDQVIVEGQGGLKDGAPIKILRDESAPTQES